MIVPDEVVIEALLKDARKFKSKWELHSGEPTRSKPNVVFLKRTLSNVVKLNQDRMRKPRTIENYEQDKQKKTESDLKESPNSKESSRSSRDLTSKRPKKSKSCSKSKYRSPESRSRSKKAKRKRSSSKRSPKR